MRSLAALVGLVAVCGVLQRVAPTERLWREAGHYSHLHLAIK